MPLSRATSVFATLLLASVVAPASADVTFRGCLAVLGDQDFVLSSTGTTDDAGTIRTTFESLPADFTQSCPAGVCELRIVWSLANSRWEIELDTNGPLNAPDYTTALLYYNATASSPLPPDLTLGSWVDGGFCADAITTLSGDVQATIPVELDGFSID